MVLTESFESYQKLFHDTIRAGNRESYERLLATEEFAWENQSIFLRE